MPRRTVLLLDQEERLDSIYSPRPRRCPVSAYATGWVWKHSPLRGAQLLVHLAIADVVNDANEQEFWMTTEALAAKAKVGRSAAVTALSGLVEHGFLEVVKAGGGRGNGTTFRFCFPETARSTAGFPNAVTARSAPETARSERETARSLPRYKEEPKNGITQAALRGHRDPDPSCIQCHGSGVKGYALVGEKMDRTAEVPCDCTLSDYEPRPEPSKPPADFGMPNREETA